MKIRLFLFFLLVHLIVLSSCGNHNNTQEGIINEDTIPVSIQTIKKDTLSPVFETSGYFTTDNETPLSFKSGGIIQKIYVQEGDAIQKGEILATVYAAEISSATQQAQLALQKAERDYQRAKKLYHDSVATLEQMQNAKTALKVAQQQKAAASFNKKHTEIRALENGYILKKYLQEGQIAAAGQPVFLVNSSSKNGWIFKTGVSDYQWTAIHSGDSAIITTDAMPDVRIKAFVLKKSKSVNPKTGAFQLQLKVKDSKNLHLASGLFGKATIYSSIKLSGWHIPYSALLDENNMDGTVFITNNKKIARKRSVHISSITHQAVVLDKGLKDAKYLIISGSPYLKDSSIIRIQSNK